MLVKGATGFNMLKIMGQSSIWEGSFISFNAQYLFLLNRVCRKIRTRLNIKTVYPGIGIPIITITQSERLIFIVGIPIVVRRHLYTQTIPCISICCLSILKKYIYVYIYIYIYIYIYKPLLCARMKNEWTTDKNVLWDLIIGWNWRSEPLWWRPPPSCIVL